MPEDLNAKFIEDKQINATFNDGNNINAQFGEVIVVESGDYEKIINHPFINNVEVVGKKTAKEYNLQELLEAITEQDIDDIMFGGE